MTSTKAGFIDVRMFAVRRDDWDDRGPDRGDHDRGDRERGDPRGLMIIRGFYGVQGRTVNVTEQLRSMVRDGVLSLYVNNNNLGGDPAIGADKVLIVIYQIPRSGASYGSTGREPARTIP